MHLCSINPLPTQIMQLHSLRIRRLLLPPLALSVTLLIGCAETNAPGYYNPPRASSTQDAIETAEGARTRSMVQPPSQIQLSLRTPQATAQATGMEASSEKLTPAGKADLERASVDASPQARLIPIPETFQGTLPCFHKEMRCTAQRITLTLAPNGRWRARAAYLDSSDKTSGKPLADQGCWRTVPSAPPSIQLLDAKKNVRVDLLMTANNVLRVRTIDGQTPNLTYTLNRQPDMDPMAELDGQPVPVCD